MISKDETQVLTPNKGILACTVKHVSGSEENVRIIVRKGKKEDDMSLDYFLNQVMKAK